MKSLLAGVVAVVVLAGCGGDAGISENAELQLSLRVDALRAAALAGDPVGMDSALTALHELVPALQANDELSENAAAEVADAIAGFEAVRPQIAVTTTTTTTVAPAPPSSVENDDDDD